MTLFKNEDLTQLAKHVAASAPTHSIVLDLSYESTFPVVKCRRCSLELHIMQVTFGDRGNIDTVGLHATSGLGIARHECPWPRLGRSSIQAPDGSIRRFESLRTDDQIIQFLAIHIMDWKLCDPRIFGQQTHDALDWNAHMWRDQNGQPIAIKCWNPMAFGENFTQLVRAVSDKGWAFSITTLGDMATARLWRPETPNVTYAATVQHRKQFSFVQEFRAFCYAIVDALQGSAEPTPVVNEQQLRVRLAQLEGIANRQLHTLENQADALAHWRRSFDALSGEAVRLRRFLQAMLAKPDAVCPDCTLPVKVGHAMECSLATKGDDLAIPPRV